MKKELTPNEILFDLSIPEDDEFKDIQGIPEFNEAYKRISRALSIDKEGYNLYLIDSFSKDKLKELINYIENKYKNLNSPKDICYVTIGDEKKPEAIFVSSGKGNKLKETVEEIKNAYLEIIDDFYRESTEEEKDFLVEEIQGRRNECINELMESAKKDGFEVKASSKGFAFIPLNGEEAMTEKEYDNLEDDKKEIIVENAGKLKKRAEVILEELKNLEMKSMKKLKKIYTKFLINNMEEYKDEALIEFITDDDSYEYLEKLFTSIEENIVECYTMSLEDDENEIYEVLNKYDVKVIVDNSKNFSPPVIFEEDPSLNNLIGTIEYENHNGVYTTDISLITAGSILKANEGCLILRLSSLATNPTSYYYLKKMLLSNTVSFDNNKSYMEFINVSGLKPASIPIKLKVILIGDYESYDILYNSDEDFKKLFPLKAEFSSVVEISDEVIKTVISEINNKIRKDELLKVTSDGLKEILKYLCRKANCKNKLFVEKYTIERVLLLANHYAVESKSDKITEKEIIEVAYEEEDILKEMMKLYTEKKILISVQGERVGAINGLAVLDTGYYTFGKPMRITCVAYKGTGKIIDIQKESNLSGKIHEKSINILKGLLTNLLNPYEDIPVDFHLSFEQTYGLVEGDSASIAEIISILSALSRRPIKQSIAVTGSVNQFGEVQAIGGINEKVEGFYRVCEIIDCIENKGVLLPAANKDEIILTPNVEKAIKENKFHLYEMSTLNDAIEVLILNENENIEEFYKQIYDEINKYKSKKN
ncbi:Lon protease [uncultured Clostridium sp.]|uniref:AAA family ATPase n=1 Tax=uncultured Clostridium sp. TaxID=59620 RepID=UPI000822517F|nr:AAA family ATPase [uncultured Clostridium sp.]SCJ97651.1 Lon protease [uncultured Clostridium sp.]